MDSMENIIALLCLAAISVAAILLLPDGGGKEVALALGGGVAGYLVKSAKGV